MAIVFLQAWALYKPVNLQAKNTVQTYLFAMNISGCCYTAEVGFCLKPEILLGHLLLLLFLLCLQMDNFC